VGRMARGKGAASARPREATQALRIRSRKVKIDGESLQGYHRDDLEEAWARYLPVPVEPSGTCGTLPCLSGV
jgi:hypothetical protein